MATVITIIVCVIAAVYAYKYYNLRSKVVVLMDDEPKSEKKNSHAMKLSNEIEPYTYHEDGKVKLKVLKR